MAKNTQTKKRSCYERLKINHLFDISDFESLYSNPDLCRTIQDFLDTSQSSFDRLSLYEFPLMACTKLCVLKCKVIHCVYYPGRNKRATMTKDHFLLLSCDATSVFIRQECFSSHIHNSTTYFVLYRHYITTTTIPFSQKQATPSCITSIEHIGWLRLVLIR